MSQALPIYVSLIERTREPTSFEFVCVEVIKRAIEDVLYGAKDIVHARKDVSRKVIETQSLAWLCSDDFIDYCDELGLSASYILRKIGLSKEGSFKRFAENILKSRSLRNNVMHIIQNLSNRENMTVSQIATTAGCSKGYAYIVCNRNKWKFKKVGRGRRK